MGDKHKILLQLILLITGLGIITSGLLFTILHRINRFSPSYDIITSITLLASGVLLLFIGFNIPFLFKKKPALIIILSTMLCTTAVLGFVNLYPENWIYPKINYVIGAYISGIFLFVSNSIINQIKYIPYIQNDFIKKEKRSENQYIAAISSIVISQMINPADEFKMWNSTIEQRSNINEPFFINTTENIYTYSLHIEDSISKTINDDIKEKIMVHNAENLKYDTKEKINIINFNTNLNEKITAFGNEIDMKIDENIIQNTSKEIVVSENEIDMKNDENTKQDTSKEIVVSEKEIDVKNDENTKQGTSKEIVVFEKETTTSSNPINDIIKIDKTDIKKDDDMQEAAHKILKYHFSKMLRHEPGTMLGKDIEELHDMRVAAMRMKSVMQVFDGHLNENLKSYLKNIKITRKILGTVRDLDVFIQIIEKHINNLPDDRKVELDALISTLTIERDKARGLMLFHLDSDKHNKFTLKFAKTLQKKQKWDEPHVDKYGVPCPHKVIDVVPTLLYTQLAKIRAYDDLVNEQDRSFEMLHELRIDVKIIRYTLEFFEEVLGNTAKNVIKDLKELQDNLGDLHDAVVAVNLLTNYQMYGKWTLNIDKNLINTSTPKDDPGVENYLNSRKEQIDNLLEEFPLHWEKIMSTEFSKRFARVIGSLYEE